MWLLFLPVILFTIGDASVTDTEMIMTATVSGLTASSCDSGGRCYFQGTLRAVGTTPYFGATKNNVDTWVDYVTEPAVDYITSTFFSFTPVEASWSGKVQMRYAADDQEYAGPGEYELKLRRYTGKSTSASGDSNTLTVSLSASLPSPSLAPSPTPAPTPTPTPTSTSTPAPTPTPAPSPLASPKPSEGGSPNLAISSPGTVAGVADIDLAGFGASPLATPSPTPILAPQPSGERVKNTVAIGSGLVISSLAGFLGYRKYKQLQIDKMV